LCNNSNSEKIKQGYIKALYENDILYDSSKVFEGQDELDAGKIGTHQFISMNATAIICENEKIACSVYQTCNDHGLQIPKDISIVSTSGMGLADILSPKLDTVDLAIEEIGSNAVEAMISIIESKSVPNSCKKQVEISLVKRESVSNPVKNTHNQSRKIIVVGSMNVDVTINVNSLPTDGETLISDNVVLLPGGKGANQAVGAGKLGGLVYAIGCLGNDNDGKKIYNNLVKSSVKTDGINFDANLPTGKAYINVAKNGESTIVVYPGANNSLDKYQVKKYKGLFEHAEFCLLSLEISKKTAEYTIDLCKESGTKVIVKPSTIEVLEDKVLKKIDYLVPNEKEIHRLVNGDFSVSQKAEILFDKGVKNVIVTLGSKGCYLKNKDYSISFMAAPFDAFDTTGAADAFISALAVFMSEGNDLIASIKFATYSAGISITRLGAQPSMPDRMTLDMYQDDIINSVKEVL
jgi:ribokinase